MRSCIVHGAQINGNSVIGDVQITRMCRAQVEDVIANLAEGQNCCISFERERVHNSTMTPLFSIGEILLAWKSGGEIHRVFSEISDEDPNA